MSWYKRVRRPKYRAWRRRRRTTSVTKHYLENKEEARGFINSRLLFFNTHYKFLYKRVSIRNQRSCWGSCSALKNLNFSYRLLFIPQELADYIIVHELCHLKEMNHGPRFWSLVSEMIPDYKARKKALKHYDHLPVHSMKVE